MLMDYLDKLNEKKQDKQESDKDEYELMKTVATINEATRAVNSVEKAVRDESQMTRKVEVVNQIDKKDIAVNNLIDYRDSFDNLRKQLEAISESTNVFAPLLEAINLVGDKIDKLPTEIEIPENEKVESVEVNNLHDYTEQIQSIGDSVQTAIDAIKSLKLDPKINVKADAPDISGIEKALSDFTTAISTRLEAIQAIEIHENDMTPLISAVAEVRSAINNLKFPIPNYVIPFKNTDGKGEQVQLDSNGNVPIVDSTTFTAGAQFDYIGIANNSSTQDTLTYKNGGASGTTVRTLVITYAAGASKISDDITSLDYS